MSNIDIPSGKLVCIVAGGRHFQDYKLLRSKLLYIFSNYDLKDVTIVSGGAKGADSLGERFAKEFSNKGVSLLRKPADWKTFGKRAGYLRNAEMAEISNACVCFWDGESAGTKHMIDIATERGLMLQIIRYEDFNPNQRRNYVELPGFNKGRN
jgi:YspA, cpYpsA-related SLOG family